MASARLGVAVSKRAPMDARCAWRAMEDDQRRAFLLWLTTDPASRPGCELRELVAAGRQRWVIEEDVAPDQYRERAVAHQRLADALSPFDGVEV